MNIKIKLPQFKAVSLARADEYTSHRFLRGIWLDFAKNRIMATDSHMLMVTLPGKGMEIEIPPTRHAHLNIPATAVEEILKITDEKAQYLTIKSNDETNAIITDGVVEVRFVFDKSKMPNPDSVINMDCTCKSADTGFFGTSFDAQFLWKTTKAAHILTDRHPRLRFYPSTLKKEFAPTNIVINEEILAVIMPMRDDEEPPSLDWKAQTEQAA